MERGVVELHNLITGKSLTIGGQSVIRDEFPLGEGYYTLWLEFILSFTNGSGANGVTEGALNFIKNILIKSDRDGVIVNCAGKGLHRLAQIFNKTALQSQDVAASPATATLRTVIPIHFANPLLMRPNDTVLDTSRYTQLELFITLGTVADLVGTVGTSTVTCTLNVSVERSHGALPAQALPIATTYIVNTPAVPQATTYQDLERAKDLAMLMMLIHTATSGDGTAFAGTLSSAVVNDLTVEDNLGFPVRSIPQATLTQINKADFELETALTGWYILNFSKDQSIMSAYPTGDKSRVQTKWTSSGSGTTPYVTSVIVGARQLRA